MKKKNLFALIPYFKRIIAIEIKHLKVKIISSHTRHRTRCNEPNVE